MESIFQSVGMDRDEVVEASPDDSDNYLAHVKALIEDSEDFNLSVLTPAREKAVKYYEGVYPSLDTDEEVEEEYSSYDEEDGEEANKSSAVSTDVRDTVLAILPSLMRIFTSEENVVDFVANNESTDELAKQQTDYINHVFWRDNNGFLILHDAIKDLLTNKIGVVAWRSDEISEVKVREFHNISILQLSNMLQEWEEAGGEVEILEIKPSKSPGMLDEVEVRYTTITPKHVVEGVPLDEFRIDRNARSIKSSKLVGRQSMKTVSEVISLGVDAEVAKQHATNTAPFTEERYIRNPGSLSGSIYDMVSYGEYYIRVDKDEDGLDELRYICTVGDNYEVVSDEVVDDVNMALFLCDPRPHAAIGDSIADLTMDIQKINTQILRGSLDSLSKSMYPDLVVNETLTNVNDVLADGVGRVIRTKTDPSAAVKEFSHSFIGSSAFEMMATIDGIRQRRTGISEASKGLDPRALQSTNVVGVEAVVSGAQERIELIARIIAHTGYKDLFEGLLREVCRYPAKARTIKIRGKWIDVNPSLFDANMTIHVNPNMGKGSDAVRLSVLNDVKSTQLMIIEKFGISNPIVTPQHVMNTVRDIMALGNVKNFSRYFGEVTPEILSSIQNAPKEPSPEELIAKAEIEKVKAQTAKAVAERATAERKLDMDEDFRRDKLTLDTLSKVVSVLDKVQPSEMDSAVPMIKRENHYG